MADPTTINFVATDAIRDYLDARAFVLGLRSRSEILRKLVEDDMRRHPDAVAMANTRRSNDA